MGTLELSEKEVRRNPSGIRKDRCFKVYLEMPAGVPEDEVMDYLEDAIRCYRQHEPPRRAHGFDEDTVVVKRATPKYVDHA